MSDESSGVRFSSSSLAESSSSSLDSVAAASAAGQGIGAESDVPMSDKGRHLQQKPDRDHDVVLIAVDTSRQAEDAFDCMSHSAAVLLIQVTTNYFHN